MVLAESHCGRKGRELPGGWQVPEMGCLNLDASAVASWFAAQGIGHAAQGGGISSSWVAELATSLQAVLFSKRRGCPVAPVLAAFCVLKSALDAARGTARWGSIVSAFFCCPASAQSSFFQSWIQRVPVRTTDMLTAAWNFSLDDSAGSSGMAFVGRFLITRASAIHCRWWIGVSFS